MWNQFISVRKLFGNVWEHKQTNNRFYNIFCAKPMRRSSIPPLKGFVQFLVIDNSRLSSLISRLLSRQNQAKILLSYGAESPLFKTSKTFENGSVVFENEQFEVHLVAYSNASCSIRMLVHTIATTPSVRKQEGHFKKSGLRDSQNRLGMVFLADSENPSGTFFLNQCFF